MVSINNQGQENWRTELNDGLDWCGLISDENSNIYVISSFIEIGIIYSISMEGNINWTIEGIGNVNSVPSIYKGVLYIMDRKIDYIQNKFGRIYAIK